MNKEHYTWEQVRTATSSIIQKMALDKYTPDCVVGILRGGLIPAVMVSHYFNIPMKAVTIQLRDGKEIDVSQLSSIVYYDKVLYIDDINDTGETFKYISDNTDSGDPGLDVENKYAALIDNMGSNFPIDYSCYEINKTDHNVWCEFPWEKWW